jgi:hypothetical protein
MAMIEMGLADRSLSIADAPVDVAANLYHQWLGASVMVKILRTQSPSKPRWRRRGGCWGSRPRGDERSAPRAPGGDDKGMTPPAQDHGEAKADARTPCATGLAVDGPADKQAEKGHHDQQKTSDCRHGRLRCPPIAPAPPCLNAAAASRQASQSQARAAIMMISTL